MMRCFNSREREVSSASTPHTARMTFSSERLVSSTMSTPARKARMVASWRE